MTTEVLVRREWMAELPKESVSRKHDKILIMLTKMGNRHCLHRYVNIPVGNKIIIDLLNKLYHRK